MRSIKSYSKRILVKLRHLRPQKVNDERYVYLISVVLGLQTGLIVVWIKNLIFYIKDYLRFGLPFEWQSYLYFVLPLLGIFLTVLCVRFFANGNLPNGISHILYSINRNASYISTKQTVLQPLTSALTIGFGGSVGLEGPSALMGSAWGSFYGRFFHMDRRMTTLMLACGTSATIGAIFSSPIAGVIFSLEVFLLDINVIRIIPVLLSSVSANIVSRILFKNEVLFHFTLVDEVTAGQLVFYVILGALTGLLGVMFMRLIYITEYYLKRIPRWSMRLLIGGTGLGLMILVMPTLYGEGYSTLSLIIMGQEEATLQGTFFSGLQDSQWAVVLFLAGSLIFKAIAAAFTRGAGGNGGVFAPCMFVGGIGGFLFARIFNILMPWMHLSEVNFTLVGMAGVSSGVLHTPLTAIFQIAEITRGYELFIPLMIVSVISLVVKKQFIPYSFYTYGFKKEGGYKLYDRDQIILQEMKIGKFIEKGFVTVKEEGKLKDLVSAVSSSNRNIFPVLDSEKNLKGIILLNDVRKMIFRPDLYETQEIKNLMHAPPALVDFNDSMEEVMRKFDESEAWNLPVVRRGKYKGFISKSRIFSIYRARLKKQGKIVD